MPLCVGTRMWRLLPPRPGFCPVCGAKHPPGGAHLPESVYYHLRFYQQYRRLPTEADAQSGEQADDERT